MRNSARILVFMLACIVMIGACMTSFADKVTESDNPRFYALVIGNGKYPASNMDPLPETATDAAAMKTALENMNPAWTVAEAYNIKGCEFVPAMEEAFRDASEGDVCLFYYTGHGGYDADYYAGALKGTDVNTPGVNYADALLPLKELADTLDRLCPGEVIVILDSCGSGSAVWNGEPLEGMTTDGTDLELLNSDETTRVGDLRNVFRCWLPVNTGTGRTRSRTTIPGRAMFLLTVSCRRWAALRKAPIQEPCRRTPTGTECLP